MLEDVGWYGIQGYGCDGMERTSLLVGMSWLAFFFFLAQRESARESW